MVDDITVAAPTAVRVVSPALTLTTVAAPATVPANVLLIEPDEDCADALVAILSSLPDVDDVQAVASIRDAVRILRAGSVPPAIVLVDDQPDSIEILRVIEILEELAPDSARVLLCVYPQCVDRRVRERVDDCVSKDLNRHELARVVERALAA